MVMQMLSAGGLVCATDNERIADEDNPRGYFEDERVKELDKGADKNWLKTHKGQALKVISFLLPHLPRDVNYRVLFIRRSMDEVLASQTKMLSHRGEDSNAVSDEVMAQSLTTHLREVDYYLKHSATFETLYLEHGEALLEPALTARAINEFLGGKLDEAAMIDAVDGSLHRNLASNC